MRRIWAKACLGKALALDNLGDCESAARNREQAFQLLRSLVEIKGLHELRDELARAYLHKVDAAFRSGETILAQTYLEPALQILEDLVDKRGRTELADELAGAYYSEAAISMRLGLLTATERFVNRAIQLYDTLITGEDSSVLQGPLALAKGLRSILFTRLEKTEEARCEARAAVNDLRAVISRTSHPELKRHLDSLLAMVADIL